MGGQRRDGGVDVPALAVRVDEGVHRESVAEIVQARGPASGLGS
jgi:hypothetical protein